MTSKYNLMRKPRKRSRENKIPNAKGHAMVKDEKEATDVKEKADQEKKPSCFIIMPITVPE
jgi:hypothetical protein